jgi:hypothetical protein
MDLVGSWRGGNMTQRSRVSVRHGGCRRPTEQPKGQTGRCEIGKFLEFVLTLLQFRQSLRVHGRIQGKASSRSVESCRDVRGILLRVGTASPLVEVPTSCDHV